MKIISLISFICFFPFASLAEAEQIESLEVVQVSRGLKKSLSAKSNTIEICNYSNVGAALEACNDRLSMLSLLSNENVQITGSCKSSDVSVYCKNLTAIVTVLDEE